MGLKSGPNGAKAVFKEWFSGAFQQIDRLVDVREACNANWEQTLVVVDGNVLMMQVPACIDTFAGYVAVVTGQIRMAGKAGMHVVVVFDEPKALTLAKRAEQAARDGRQTVRIPRCSQDLSIGITDDNYTLEDLLLPTFNAKLLISHRAARSRFFDAVCVASLDSLTCHAEDSPTFTFDGVDGRGADRPSGAPRVAGILSTNMAEWGQILHRQIAIGEGDLKLTDVCARVHTQYHSTFAVAGVVLHLIWTIDTDSMLIELISDARRVEQGQTDTLTILCLRETCRKRKDDARDSTKPGTHFTCIDISLFRESVVQYLFGKAATPSPTMQSWAIALMAASVALCGSDFVELKGIRADLILPCVRDVVRTQPLALAKMRGVSSGNQIATMAAQDPIERVLQSFLTNNADIPKLKKHVEKASAFEALHLLRAVWIAAYWSTNEFKNVLDFGFASWCVH
jgi:hypothetical protein